MRRLIALGGALLLAILGTLLLASYVQGARDRVLEGQELATVLVVDDTIRPGTGIGGLLDLVSEREIPVENVAEGAVSDLAQLEGLVAEVELVPGEQLLISRFKSPAEIAVSTRPVVPPELLQATIQLSPERVVGGRLIPGDLVAIFASFEPFDLTTAEPGDPTALDDVADTVIVVGGDATAPDAVSTVSVQAPATTRIILHKVLVTGVQVQDVPREPEDEESLVELAPSSSLSITVAATAEDMEKIIFAKEFGFIWLALEDPGAPIVETDLRTRSNIFQ